MYYFIIVILLVVIFYRRPNTHVFRGEIPNSYHVICTRDFRTRNRIIQSTSPARDYIINYRDMILYLKKNKHFFPLENLIGIAVYIMYTVVVCLPLFCIIHISKICD